MDNKPPQKEESTANQPIKKIDRPLKMLRETLFSKTVTTSFTSALKSTSYKQLEQAIPELQNFFEFHTAKCSQDSEQSNKPPGDNPKADNPSNTQTTISLGKLEMNLRTKDVSKDDASLKNQPLSPKERQLIACQGTIFLEKAISNLKECTVDVAGGHYYCAELISYYLLEKDELQAVAKQTLSNAEDRLCEADRGVVRCLIGKANEGKWSCKDNCNVQEVSAARKTVQKHNTNGYTLLSLMVQPLIVLIVAAIVVMIAIVASVAAAPAVSTAASFSATGFQASIVNASDFNAAGFNATNVNASNVTYTPEVNQQLFLVSVACFGALGAIASGIITISKDSLTGDIPKRLLSTSVMVVKPIFGALIGLVIYVFLISGLLQTLTGTPITNPLVFAVCFTAGFSEKFFLGAIEKADHDKTKQ